MKTRTLVLAGGALLLAGCATYASSRSAARAPEPLKPIDVASHFHGRWYEIGRTPMKLTDGCVAGYTDYLRDGDRIVQRDGCRDGTPMGKEKVVAGPLRILNPGANNKVRVEYRLFGFLPVPRTYHLLDHGDGWFLMSTADFKLVNLYTRDPRPSPALVDELTRRMRSLGYDVSKLEFPATFPPGQG
ncbi:MAG: lipocalin [Phenylobacterium zucineum]|nr:MAG: lipocalin [Phenylobacterium zucineum]